MNTFVKLSNTHWLNTGVGNITEAIDGKDGDNLDRLVITFNFVNSEAVSGMGDTWLYDQERDLMIKWLNANSDDLPETIQPMSDDDEIAELLAADDIKTVVITEELKDAIRRAQTLYDWWIADTNEYDIKKFLNFNATLNELEVMLIALAAMLPKEESKS